MKILTIFISLFMFNSLFASVELDSLDILLKNVKEASISQSHSDKARLAEFLKSNKNKKTLLNNAILEYKKEKQQTKRLKKEIDKNEKELTRLEEKLRLRSGNLGEMFGVVRQFGGDLRANIDNSSTSTTLKGRVEFLDTMLNTKELPDIEKLEKLWFLLQEEIIHSGKVSTHNLEIVKGDGSLSNEKVTSIGIFNAFYEDKFLRYSAETKAYIELPTQPSNRLRGIVEEFGDKRISEVVIDPTRGMILSMLTQKPTIKQRIEQGGIVGYIILSLGGIGLLIALVRFYILNDISKKVKRQLENLQDISLDNPLGRVMSIFDKHKNADMESFEAKVEEAILKELPDLKRFESLLKLIATVAPLLGLLGTVTGMIETFSAITLFGTGDPKLMAGGISQALMTTVLGLVIAIPMLFLYTFISSRSNKIIAILDEQSAGLIVKKMEYVRNN